MKDLSQHRYRWLKYALLILFLFVINSHTFAQSLAVESFRLLETDMTANTQGTIELDQNGEKSALIKIITTETGFVFEAGMLGIVKTVQKVSEIWVYVPHGLQKIKIMHSQLGQVEYLIPIPIESARTYELKLISGSTRTIVNDEATAQYVTFMVDPKSAVVFIDGQVYPTQSDGSVSELLSFGRHEYRVESRGYHSESGIIEVNKEKVQKNVVLRSSKARVTIQCQMGDADIYVNDEKVGVGTWSGELLAAIYNIESRKDGHQSRLITITLNESEERTITLPAPQPIYGQLQIKSEPNIATVHLDGEKVGETPLLLNNVLTGEHTLEIYLKGYNTYSTTINIDEGQVEIIDAKLSDKFQANINSDPQSADVIINGEHKGVTPLQLDLSIGDYRVRISKQNYITYRKVIRFSDSQRELNVNLKKALYKPTSFYVGMSFWPNAITPISTTGIHFQAGAYLQNINIEFDILPFSNKSSSLEGYWALNSVDSNDKGSTDGSESLFFSYKVDNPVVSLKLGYGFVLFRHIRVTPQVGAMFSNLVSIEDESYKLYGGSKGSKKSFICSAQADIKLEYTPFAHISVFYSPGYNQVIGMGDIATKLNNNNNVSGKFNGMFNNIGAIVFF